MPRWMSFFVRVRIEQVKPAFLISVLLEMKGFLLIKRKITRISRSKRIRGRLERGFD